MLQLAPSLVRDHLLNIGYPPSQIVSDFIFGVDDHEQRIPFAAFGQLPTDARSACIAVLDSNGDSAELVRNCLPMGAPVAFICAKNHLEFWKQSREPTLVKQISASKVSAFFDKYRGSLNPTAILRAKTRSRFEESFQLTFVDGGLIPIVEEVVGPWLTRLLERVLGKLRSEIPEAGGDWLSQAVFWLVAAKILKDKKVPKFQHLDLADIDAVMSRVKDHYGASRLLPIPDPSHRDALESASKIVGRFSGLRHVTTESLSHVYDHLLVTKKVRKELGTHSTPSFLVDYIIRRLTPEIEALCRESGTGLRVIEPGSGHAAFLVSAMRLLKELSPISGSALDLRDRLFGFELDDIAREIGRLSLTLANIPDPDGWKLFSGDFFERKELEECASRSMILLANPPFESFEPDRYRRLAERAKRDGERTPIKNKAAEVLFRCISALPQSAVFGVVVPQGILEGVASRAFRRLLCQECELIEILLLPDDPKVFTYSDSESAVIMGRRKRPESNRLRYLRLREGSIPRFQSSFAVDEEKSVAQEQLLQAPSCSMWVPALSDRFWACMKAFRKLSDIARVRRGIKYWSPRRVHPEIPRHSDKKFSDAVPGFVDMKGKPDIHDEPRLGWLCVDERAVEIFRAGRPTGRPRVLVNYAPVGRGPWRLKAFLDSNGRAITQNFIAVEPDSQYPAEFCWALLNSPLANAYVFATSRKRHVKEGTLAALPIPPVEAEGMRRIAELARAYRLAFGGQPPDRRRPLELLLQMDAEILSLYDLPPVLEHEALNLFQNCRRPVPFDFPGYYPQGLTAHLPLRELISEGFEAARADRLIERLPKFDDPEISRLLAGIK